MNKNIFRIEHIIESIVKIEALVKKLKTYDAFEDRWIEQDALIRNLEIIGEASVHISEEIKTKYPDIVWSEMKGMRNFLTHDYFGLQLDTIWDTAVNDIPELKNKMATILGTLKN